MKNLKNLNLKKIVFAICIIPAIAFGFIAITELVTDYKNYRKYLAYENTIEVITEASNLIHNLQIERGMSAAFLSGANIQDKLVNHRLKVDSAFATVEKKWGTNILGEKGLKEVLSFKNSVETYRPGILSRETSVGQHLKQYTTIIFSLLEFYNTFKAEVSDPRSIIGISNSSYLEEAKENGGKLRANLSAIASKGEPINNKRMNVVLGFYAGLNSNLKSFSLMLDSDAEEKITTLFQSSQWTNTSGAVASMISDRYTGKYKFESSAIFADVTTVLNGVRSLIVAQKKGMKSSVEEKITSVWNDLIYKGVMLIALICLISFTTFFGLRYTNKFIEGQISHLDQNFHSINSVSGDLNKSGVILASSASQQSAAVQESTAAVTELKSIMTSNSSLVQSNTEKTQDAYNFSVEGMKQIDNMKESAKEVSQVQSKLVEIKEMVDSIEEKTTIINDIVFKTQLLAFNAAIEAARAGQHGRGFSVVAEEVGTLASVSGKASEEISAILGKSKTIVEEAVATSQEKVDKLITDTESSWEAFNNISHQTQSISSVFKDIETSTEQMVTGVDQLQTALTELNDSANQVDIAAGSNQSLSNQLQSDTENADSVVTSIKKFLLAS